MSDNQEWPPKGIGITPFYYDDWTVIYHGDCLELLPHMPEAYAIITDPPYGETSLDWDRWPDGWPTLAERVAPQLLVLRIHADVLGQGRTIRGVETGAGHRVGKAQR